MAKKNKVKYGLKNVHIAVRTITDGVESYETPFRLEGAVNISLPPKGDKVEFYADDYEYFKVYVNQGYEGTLEVALINDDFKEKILKEIKDKNGVQFESSEAIFADFALMFEFSGDEHKTRHIFYNCTVERPNIESGTKATSIDVKTETLNITASPNLAGYTKASVKQGETEYENWFVNAYEYVPPTESAANESY